MKETREKVGGFSFGFLFGTKTTIRLSQFCVGLLTEVILKGKKVIVHYERYQKNMTLFSTGSAMINNGNRVLGLTAIDHGQSSVLFRIPFKNLPSSLKKLKLFFFCVTNNQIAKGVDIKSTRLTQLSFT